MLLYHNRNGENDMKKLTRFASLLLALCLLAEGRP